MKKGNGKRGKKLPAGLKLDPKKLPVAAEVIKMSLADFGDNSMRIYGQKTNEDRSIPDYYDGCKPVQRRIMQSFVDEGARSKNAHMKTARIVGRCFVEGTPVSTPNGPVAIENLEVGDEVLTTQGPKKVLACIHNPPHQMANLTTMDGRHLTLTPTQEIKVMKDGKFFWKPANELTKEDVIVVES
jgi:DNA gyrase subunit A